MIKMDDDEIRKIKHLLADYQIASGGKPLVVHKSFADILVRAGVTDGYAVVGRLPILTKQRRKL